MDRFTSMSVFVKAVEAGSFAAAASALGISAPMVGKHVHRLEEHIVLAEVEAAEDMAAESRAAPRGHLRVNAPVTFGAHCLAHALPEYLQEYADVTVELTLSDRIVDLVEDGFEAVIRIGPLADSSLIARALAPYRLTACAAPAYLSERGMPKHPEDLRHHECLGSAHWAPRGDWTFQGPKGPVVIKVTGRLGINSGQALRAAALEGFGVILQPEALLADDIAQGRLVKVLAGYEPPSRAMHIVYAPDRRPTPKLRSFIDFVLERFGTDAAS
jgi:DNA-binding transcriptional LysR family regulator